nr:MAG TPA: hypothetical protein [Caudoviricetes sp.]
MLPELPESVGAGCYAEQYQSMGRNSENDDRDFL